MMHTADIARIVLGAWTAGLAAGAFIILGWRRPTARLALVALVGCFVVAAAVSYIVTGPSIDEAPLRVGRAVTVVAGLAFVAFVAWILGDAGPSRLRMWLAAFGVLVLQSLTWGFWEYLRVVGG